MFKFIVKGKEYEITKDVLKEQMKTAENNHLDKKVNSSQNQNVIQLPSWVETQQFQAVHQYLVLAGTAASYQKQKKQDAINKFLTKNIVSNQRLNTTKKLIHIMRVSDYLTLQKFQHFFIQKCVIDTLNNENCIPYLEQTHKKLKNSSSGTAQAWYNLLNSCIDFISFNLPEIYLIQPEGIQKLHQKILGQILDRSIKYHLASVNKSKNEKKVCNDQKQKEIIFNLLMKSKKVNSVDALCNSLKSILQHKKINKKMHAKLSWKLHDLHQIMDKKVKNFKFLDLNWVLEAIRNPDRTLKVKLTLMPIEGQNTNYSLNYYVGVFYSKLYWSIDKFLGASQLSTSQTHKQSTQNTDSQKTQGQKPLEIHYICLKNPISTDIFLIDNELEKSLINRKLQLSIYCSIDQCYSFVINHIINDYNKLRMDQKRISKDEIYAIIEGSKSLGKYSQAVWFIKHLAKNQIQIPLYLLERLPFDKLPTYQTEFLKKLIKNENPILEQAFGKKQGHPRMVQIQNDINSLTSSKISDNQDTKSNHSRAGSRGRHRKIFGQSPQKTSQQNLQMKNLSINISSTTTNKLNSVSMNKSDQNVQLQRQKQLQLLQIMQVTNMKNYFFDKNSPLLELV